MDRINITLFNSTFLFNFLPLGWLRPEIQTKLVSLCYHGWVHKIIETYKVFNRIISTMYNVHFLFTLVSQYPQWSLAVWRLRFQAGVKPLNLPRLPLCSKRLQGRDARRPPVAWRAQIWTQPAEPETRCNLDHSLWKIKALRSACTPMHVVTTE